MTKNIVTGEGGMVITDNEEYANQIKILGLHGMSKDAWKRFSDQGHKHYQVVYAGFKYNMMDLQAAIGMHQLPRVDKYWETRQEIRNCYDEAFKDLSVFTPALTEPNARHAYHLYTLLLDIGTSKITRDEFLDEMTRRNIGVAFIMLPCTCIRITNKPLATRGAIFQMQNGFQREQYRYLLHQN